MTAPIRSLDDGERRRRLGRRHHLARRAPANALPRVAADLLGLHATDPVSIYLAARARVARTTPADVERALYDDRLVLRTLAMRRTMFVIPIELAPILQAAVSDAVAVVERKRLAKQLEVDGVAPEGAGLRWIDRIGRKAVAALEERGEATASELQADVPELAAKLHLAPGKSYAATVSAASRVLIVLSAQGRVVRGRPLGTWISTQYKWAPMSAVLGEAAPAPVPVAEARAELARRWLATFGPATEADLKWWTGWPLGQTRAALAANDTVAVRLDGGQEGFVLAGDVAAEAEVVPWVALLPALDPTAMGWAGRDWYLGAHRERLFDGNGNIGPTVWFDGRIVGGWAHRSDGTVALGLLEDPGTEATTAIEAEAGRVEAWLGDVRFKTRFPTPLERELRS